MSCLEQQLKPGQLQLLALLLLHHSEPCFVAAAQFLMRLLQMHWSASVKIYVSLGELRSS